MSKLSVKFDNTTQKIDNPDCCPKGVILSFKVENMVPGVQYNCSLSTIGSGSAVFKPNNFNITGTQISESFMVVAELKNTRVHVIKVSIVNNNDNTDRVEDIMTLECGQPKFLAASFEQNNIIIDCGGFDNSLIGKITNLISGNRYAYSFSALDSRESGNLKFSPPSGTVIATTDVENINTLVQYSGRSKSVIVKLTVTDSYNNFSDSTLATLKCK
jgi:hypothetical protein